MHITIDAIKIALSTVIDPNTNINLISSKAVKNIDIHDNDISITIELNYPANSQIEIIRNAALQAIKKLQNSGTVNIKVQYKILAHAIQQDIQLKTNIKNIIAIASGKGGVGKSTTAVNLALALVFEGARVGILDADIYGPSQPMMLGINNLPKSYDGKTMEPLQNYGLQVSSIGFLIKSDEPIIWRGPMVTQALQQLLNQTNWHDLDYLIVDMPPGTGDIQLTLSQKVPVTGAVIITTPQDISLLNASKSLKMFKKVKIPVLGIIENMSTYICPNCAYAEAIFGSGGAQKLCVKFQVDLLGILPLMTDIRIKSDSGYPTVVADPNSIISQTYKNIARKIAIKITEKSKDINNTISNIAINNN